MSAGNPWDAPTYGTGGVPAPQNHPPGPGPWGLPARSQDPGRALRVVGVILFGLAAFANLLDLFGPDSAWKNPSDEAGTVLFVVGCALTAALLLPRRTRDLAAGFAIAQALTETARYIYVIRPSYLGQWDWVQKISFTGSYATTALGGIIIAIAVLREQRVVTRVARMPVPALVLGIPAVLLYVVSLLVSDYSMLFSGDSTSFTCCSWSVSSGFDKTSYVLAAVALVACVLLAALATRPGFAKGVLGGVVLFVLVETVVTAIQIFLPTQAEFGFGSNTTDHLTAHPKAGFWLELAGMALFAIAFFMQGYRSGKTGQAGQPQAGPYPGAVPGYPQPGWPTQPGYTQPGYPQPGYAQPGYPQPGYAQPGYPQPGWQQQPPQSPSQQPPQQPPQPPRMPQPPQPPHLPQQ